MFFYPLCLAVPLMRYFRVRLHPEEKTAQNFIDIQKMTSLLALIHGTILTALHIKELSSEDFIKWETEFMEDPFLQFQFNLHRMYGPQLFSQLFANWKQVYTEAITGRSFPNSYQPLHVVQKVTSAEELL